MKKINLKVAADEFETISDGIYLFYNTKTGKFDFYTDLDDKDNNAEKFKNAAWVACPSQRDINGYNIMVDFAENVADSHKSELLFVALEGKGAFRRFKDTLHRVNLIDEWYEFKRKAFMEIAKEWCDEHNIKYDDGEADETKFEFEAVIQKVPDKNVAYIVVPFDIKAKFGKGRLPVHVTFDGELYDGSIVNMGVKNPDSSICYILGIRKDIRAKIGKQSGDTVRVTIQRRAT
jgi:hypothetical protein